MQAALHPRGLYAITDPALTAQQGVVAAVASAIRGGAQWIQYRNKTATLQQQLCEAMALATLCTTHQVTFIVNDNPRLACDVDADGVHIGGDDDDCATARRVVGKQRIIGVSCYASLQRALDAQMAGADYVAFGSMFPSSSKPGAVPATLPLLTQSRSMLAVPIVAIGGITPENVDSVLSAGADMIAVISGVFGAGNPETAANAYVSRILRHSSPTQTTNRS
jgi:thiamine-phosphate pyrophosphorylase